MIFLILLLEEPKQASSPETARPVMDFSWLEKDNLDPYAETYLPRLPCGTVIMLSGN